jgi:hypothetical protein
MQQIDRRRVLAAAALAALVGACSGDFNMNDIDPSRKLMTLTRPNWLTFSGHSDELTLPAVTEADLISRNGQCAYSAPSSATGLAAPGLAQGGVSLQMTECDVVNRVGAPDNLEFGVNERGERSVAMTYLRGPRPGIYRFAGGRLNSIERGPEAPSAPKQQQRPPAKKTNPA